MGNQHSRDRRQEGAQATSAGGRAYPPAVQQVRSEGSVRRARRLLREEVPGWP